ncbi:MAG: hypothetical protein P4L68_07400 [Methylovirgula sp.]|nr:hypothetical protein [Methylovirgula sp.]
MLSANRKLTLNITKICGALAAALVSITILSSSAMAFTCDDVRGLSRAEQDYWVKRLNISTTERRQIWGACYRDYRPGLQAQLVRR